ncbi:MAG TPA: MBL fold metallo-hydrolase [Verrucomicrobiae bacterium]
MHILSNCGGIAMTNCFLIADESTKVAVLFDAPDHTTTPLLEQAASRGWDVIGLWVTHGHFDHFADHATVKRRFPNATLLIHPLDEQKALHPDIQTRLFGLPLTVPPLKPDAHVSDGQQLKIGGIPATVIHTPGHSPGHVCYYLPTEGVLIGGDLIIGGSVGRTDLPDSNHSELEASIRRVMELPPATRLLGGHGVPTTLGDERRENPFVRAALA